MKNRLFYYKQGINRLILLIPFMLFSTIGYAQVTPVSCTVFDDGYTNQSSSSDAIYFAGSSKACTPDGTALGNCRKWFGRCTTKESNPIAVNFKVFNDGDNDQTALVDAVYMNSPNKSCIPDGSPSGDCRRWFGLPETTDNRKVQCYLFDDGYSNKIGPTHAIYYANPGKVCMPDGTSSGACRKWFGQCTTIASNPDTDPDPTGFTTVPNVVGLSLTSAVSKIRNAGLKPDIINDDGQTGPIFSQNPQGGKQVRRGSQVTIVVRPQHHKPGI